MKLDRWLFSPTSSKAYKYIDNKQELLQNENGVLLLVSSLACFFFHHFGTHRFDRMVEVFWTSEPRACCSSSVGIDAGESGSFLLLFLFFFFWAIEQYERFPHIDTAHVNVVSFRLFSSLTILKIHTTDSHNMSFFFAVCRRCVWLRPGYVYKDESKINSWLLGRIYDIIMRMTDCALATWKWWGAKNSISGWIDICFDDLIRNTCYFYFNVLDFNWDSKQEARWYLRTMEARIFERCGGVQMRIDVEMLFSGSQTHLFYLFSITHTIVCRCNIKQNFHRPCPWTMFRLALETKLF